MDNVRAFDIPVDDMQRAKRFYERIFGWQIHPIPGSGGNFHAAHTVPVDENDEPQIRGAINGGLYKRDTHGLRETFLEVSVPSIDEYLKKIEAEGGQLIKPKGPILDIAFFAVVKDTEGNAIGLWEDVKKIGALQTILSKSKRFSSHLWFGVKFCSTHRATLIDVGLLFGLMDSDVWKSWYAKKEGTVEPEITKLLELLEKCNASRVLDFGCGAGRHTVFFARKGFEVYGFDASEAAIERARELLGTEDLEASLRVWDMTQPLPYQEDFFDAVLALRVVHHTYARNIELIVGEIHRVLKSGGYLFLQVSAYCRSETLPDKREDHRFREVEPRTFVPLEGEEKGIPHHEFTKKELSKLFGNYRFIDIHRSTEHYPGWCLIARKR